MYRWNESEFFAPEEVPEALPRELKSQIRMQVLQ